MDQQEKIYKIYKIISNKDLKPWCDIILKLYPQRYPMRFQVKQIEWRRNGVIPTKVNLFNFPTIVTTSKNDFYIQDDPIAKWEWFIHWNPVMIWDVLNYIENVDGETLNKYRKDRWLISVNYIKENTILDIITLWKNKVKPIEYQEINCIEYVYNLINK